MSGGGLSGGVYRIEREWIRAFGDTAAGEVVTLPGRYDKATAIAIAREQTSRRHRQRVIDETTGQVVWQPRLAAKGTER